MTPKGRGAGGRGMGRNASGGGRGMSGGRGLGPNGNCICFEVKCPKCNSSMTRE